MLILLLQTKFTNQTLVGAKITALPPQVFSERELVRYMLSPVRLSSVCNARACALLRRFKFSAIFYGIRYLGHPLTSAENFTEIVPPRRTPPPGELNTRGVAKYSDFGPIDGYISETVQDRR